MTVIAVGLILIPRTTNDDEVIAVPCEVTTAIGPVVAAEGTMTVTVCESEEMIWAAAPLNETALALVKLVPVIITLVPGTPWFGVKLVMVGAM